MSGLCVAWGAPSAGIPAEPDGAAGFLLAAWALAVLAELRSSHNKLNN